MTADTYALVRRLRDVGFEERQAAEIVDVARQAHDDYVTKDYLDCRLSDLKADLTWRIVTVFGSLFVAACGALFAIARYVH